MSKSKKMRKLIKSAKMGKAPAMYKLGIYYELNGDMNTAATWISNASDAGYSPAIEWMGDYKFDDDAAVQGNA